MTATKERNILMKATDQKVDGILADIKPLENSYLMIFESGESIRMPKTNYTIPFDLYEGMHIVAEWRQEPGWDKRRFVLTSMEEPEEVEEFDADDESVPF